MPGRRRLRSWARLLVAGVITAGLLFWALRGISAAEVWEAVRTAEPGWLALGLLTFLGSFAVRARRWGTLIGASCPPGSFELRHTAIYIGFAVNNILPARAGEVSRAVVLSRTAGIPLGVAVGSIVAERMLDVVTLFSLFLVSLLIALRVQSLGGTVEPTQVVWFGLALVTLSVCVFAAACWPDRIARLVGQMSCVVGLGRFAPRLERVTGSLFSGLKALRDPKRTSIAFAETLAVWGLTAFTYWAAMRAFEISSPGAIGAVLVMSVVGLAIAIPSSPGQFGPFEAGVRLTLSAYSLPSSVIVAFGLTLHLLLYLSVTLIGIPFAVRFGFSWRDPTRSETSPTPYVPADKHVDVQGARIGGS